jgi:hypothetical protein
MYRMMNIIEFERELNAHDAAVKCRNAANKLQNNIFRVYCRDQSTETITNMAKRM